MFAATMETLPSVGEGDLRDLKAKTGKEALASSRTRAAHVAMARKGKAFGLAGVMLVDRNLDFVSMDMARRHANICDYLW